MTSSCLRKEEILAWKLQGFPVLCDEREKCVNVWYIQNV